MVILITYQFLIYIKKQNNKPVSSEFKSEALKIMELLSNQYPGKMLILVVIDDPISMGTSFTVRISMPTIVGTLYKKTMTKMKLTIAKL